jgi:phenylpyruvate tautomerase PptA (4-oxalocrotonate tautomerase family)
MPYIHIKSLEFENGLETSGVIKQVSQDFSEATGIAVEHITVTWSFLPPGHYAVAGEVADYQPITSHPLMVDLLVPDFNSSERIEQMIQKTARSLSLRAQIPIDNIFINCRVACSGQVFDGGEIVYW